MDRGVGSGLAANGHISARDISARDISASSIDARVELTTAVVQRISWVGLTLASVVSQLDGPAATRVHEAVEELDALIRDIRANVFELLIAPPGRAEG